MKIIGKNKNGHTLLCTDSVTISNDEFLRYIKCNCKDNMVCDCHPRDIIHQWHTPIIENGFIVAFALHTKTDVKDNESIEVYSAPGETFQYILDTGDKLKPQIAPPLEEVKNT